jgi:hypothetical protein
MKSTVFWDVTPCGSCKNRCFGGTITSIIRVTKLGKLGTTLAARCAETHLDDEGDTSFRNFGAYKSHTGSVQEDGILYRLSTSS